MFRRSVAEALRELNGGAATYRRLLERADFDAGIYRPRGTDDQTAHARDEIYVVASGSGEFVYAGDTQRIETGDILFVERGVDHRFVNFSEDFSTWVVFIGARS